MKIFCAVGLHRYEMFQYCDDKGRFTTMGRECATCGKRQIAKRPAIYHPTKYVWKDEPLLKLKGKTK
jgi:hypothetical protein